MYIYLHAYRVSTVILDYLQDLKLKYAQILEKTGVLCMQILLWGFYFFLNDSFKKNSDQSLKSQLRAIIDPKWCGTPCRVEKLSLWQIFRFLFEFILSFLTFCDLDFFFKCVNFADYSSSSQTLLVDPREHLQILQQTDFNTVVGDYINTM